VERQRRYGMYAPLKLLLTNLNCMSPQSAYGVTDNTRAHYKWESVPSPRSGFDSQYSHYDGIVRFLLVFDFMYVHTLSSASLHLPRRNIELPIITVTNPFPPVTTMRIRYIVPSCAARDQDSIPYIRTIFDPSNFSRVSVSVTYSMSSQYILPAAQLTSSKFRAIYHHQSVLTPCEYGVTDNTRAHC
jgi:hypothetical protein